MLIGYARVSKGDEQSNKAQARALSEAGCKCVLEEKASGGRWDRPELHCMLDKLRDGDTVVRLEAGSPVAIRSLTEAIDTTTAAGRMMIQMVGSFAEFERAMIRERTTTGLAQARAEGRIGGRRKKLDPKKRRESLVGPQKRSRNGKTLRYQQTDGFAHRRRISPESGDLPCRPAMT